MPPAPGALGHAGSPGNVEGDHPDEDRLPGIGVPPRPRRAALYRGGEQAPFFGTHRIHNPVRSLAYFAPRLHQERPCLVRDSDNGPDLVTDHFTKK